MATSDNITALCVRERPRWRLALCVRQDSTTTSLFVRLETVGFLDRRYGVSMDPAVLMQLVADLVVIFRYLTFRRALPLPESPEAILEEILDCTKHYRFKIYEERTPDGVTVERLHPRRKRQRSAKAGTVTDAR